MNQSFKWYFMRINLFSYLIFYFIFSCIDRNAIFFRFVCQYQLLFFFFFFRDILFYILSIIFFATVTNIYSFFNQKQKNGYL